jgi:hypothetical protein
VSRGCAGGRSRFDDIPPLRARACPLRAQDEGSPLPYAGFGAEAGVPRAAGPRAAEFPPLGGFGCGPTSCEREVRARGARVAASRRDLDP